MRVNFQHQFFDHKGKMISNGDSKAATLKEIVVDAMMYPSPEELKGMSVSEKVKRHDLAVRIIQNGNDTDLTAEDLSLLKKIVGDRYVPIVVAQAYAVLEGKKVPTYVELPTEAPLAGESHED